jgi:hypothetical protein
MVTSSWQHWKRDSPSLLRSGWAIVAIVTAIVLVIAWLALVGSAALGLIGLGLAPAFAMLWLAAANLLLAFVGWRIVDPTGLAARGPQACAARLSRASSARLHRQAQTEAPRIAANVSSRGLPLSESVRYNVLAGKPGFLGECRHSTDSVRNGTQCDGNGPLIAVDQHRFQVLRGVNRATYASPAPPPITAERLALTEGGLVRLTLFSRQGREHDLLPAYLRCFSL